MDKTLILEVDYMYLDTVCTNIKLYSGSILVVTDFIDDIILRAFGNWSDKASIIDLNKLFEYRCFPKHRENTRELMGDIGCIFHNPRSIIKVTHGFLVEDSFWLRFSDEKDLTWEQVRNSCLV